MSLPLSEQDTIEKNLQRHAVSHRSFLKFCTIAASSMNLPISSASAIANIVALSTRPKVICLYAQERTSPTETLLRAYQDYPVESLILKMVSLDYHNILMASLSSASKDALMASFTAGDHIVVLDDSIAINKYASGSVISRPSILDVLQFTVADASLIIPVANSAARGGFTKSVANPSVAKEIADLIGKGELITNARLINNADYQPIAEVFTAAIFNFILQAAAANLDHIKHHLPDYERELNSALH